MRKAVRVGPHTSAVVALVIVASMIGVPSAHATGGTELWVTRTPWPDYSSLVGVAVSPDGSHVFATGWIFVSSGDRFQTVAYDASGAEVWVRRHGQDGPFNNGAAAIGVSPDGSTVFVTGVASSATDIDYLTLAYDAATGTRVWKRQYTPVLVSQDVPAALGVSPDGSTVFVTGESSGGPTGKDYLTVAYAASTGKLLWTARYNLSFRDSARTLSVSPNGSAVFVSGYSVSDTSLDIETIAYDATTGEPLWKSRYDGPTHHEDQANAMAVSPDGSRVYLTGFSEGSNRARDISTLAYRASTGALLWVRRYNGPGDGNDTGKAIAVSPDGSRIFVTGYRQGHLSRDAETLAYSSAGRLLWRRAYNGPTDNDDQATAIGVSPDGKQVFVAGFRYLVLPDRDFVTLAYRASSGDHLWEAFYQQDRATATALGVNPDGSAVYVSGTSGPDWATVAYSTS